MTKNLREYKQATISRENLKGTTIGHLEPILNCEVGGFPRMLVNMSLVELGGRIIIAQEQSEDVFKYEYLYKTSFVKMMTLISKVTGNKVYEDKKVHDCLWNSFRNGLAHLMLPLRDYEIDDFNKEKHLIFTAKGHLRVGDKLFSRDLIQTFEYLLSSKKEAFKLVVGIEDPDILKFSAVNC